QEASLRFQADLEGLPVAAPKLAVLSSVDGQYYQPHVTSGFIAHHLARQLTARVEFAPCLLRLYEEGVTVLLASGPGAEPIGILGPARPQEFGAAVPPELDAVEQLLRQLACAYAFHQLAPAGLRAFGLEPKPLPSVRSRGAAGVLACELVRQALREAPGAKALALERFQLFMQPGASARQEVEVRGELESREEHGAHSRLTVRLLRAGEAGRPLARGVVILGEAEGKDLAEVGEEAWQRAFDEGVALAPQSAGTPQVLGAARVVRGEAPALRVAQQGRELHVDLAPQAAEDLRLWGLRVLLPVDRMQGMPFDQEGGLREPEAFPLLERRLEAGPSFLVMRRTVSLAREPYLEQHRLDGVPLVPAAIHAEALLEGARLLRPRGTAVAIEDFSVGLAVRLVGERAVDLRVVARGDASLVETTLASDFVDPQGRTLVKDRLHARAVVRFGEPLPPRRMKEAASLLRQGERAGVSPESSSQAGARPHSLRWERLLGQGELLACVLPPPAHSVLGHTAVPRFTLHPFFLEGCFQA
ncbi:MAG TPA: hypothetical protein VF815_34955, partial [Myxococcaceae bacterium]